MGRQRRQRRQLAEERWPHLSNMFAIYFGLNDGISASAFEAASRDGPVEHCRAVLNEWRDWNTTEGAVRDIRPFLEDGFLVRVKFDEPMDARHFMNRVYDSLIERVRAETGEV